MLLAVYMPSWQGAFLTLPFQLIFVGSISLALFHYARQRHGPRLTAGVLLVGIAAGLAFGVVSSWRSWAASPSMWGLSRERTCDYVMIGFFELGESAVYSAGGAIAAWIVLELAAVCRATLTYARKSKEGSSHEPA